MLSPDRAGTVSRMAPHMDDELTPTPTPTLTLTLTLHAHVDDELLRAARGGEVVHRAQVDAPG
eukprot:scaffold74593_cov36-Phaeocystis_antarctica.AAC.1